MKLKKWVLRYHVINYTSKTKREGLVLYIVHYILFIAYRTMINDDKINVLLSRKICVQLH